MSTTPTDFRLINSTGNDGSLDSTKTLLSLTTDSTSRAIGVISNDPVGNGCYYFEIYMSDIPTSNPVLNVGFCSVSDSSNEYDFDNGDPKLGDWYSNVAGSCCCNDNNGNGYYAVVDWMESSNGTDTNYSPDADDTYCCILEVTSTEVKFWIRNDGDTNFSSPTNLKAETPTVTFSKPAADVLYLVVSMYNLSGAGEPAEIDLVVDFNYTDYTEPSGCTEFGPTAPEHGDIAGDITTLSGHLGTPVRADIDQDLSLMSGMLSATVGAKCSGMFPKLEGSIEKRSLDLSSSLPLLTGSILSYRLNGDIAGTTPVLTGSLATAHHELSGSLLPLTGSIETTHVSLTGNFQALDGSVATTKVNVAGNLPLLNGYLRRLENDIAGTFPKLTGDISGYGWSLSDNRTGNLASFFPGFTGHLQSGNGINSSIPAMTGSATATLTYHGTLNGTITALIGKLEQGLVVTGALPSLTGTVSVLTGNRASIENELPSISGALYGSATLKGNLKSLNGSATAEQWGLGTIDAALSTVSGGAVASGTASIAGSFISLTGSGAVQETNQARLTSKLPKLVGVLHTAGILSGTLSAMSGELQLQEVLAGNLEKAFPKFSGKLHGLSGLVCNISRTFPGLTGNITAEVYTRATIDRSVRKLRGVLIGSNAVYESLSGGIPALIGAMSAHQDTTCSVSGNIPSLVGLLEASQDYYVSTIEYRRYRCGN